MRCPVCKCIIPDNSLGCLYCGHNFTNYQKTDPIYSYRDNNYYDNGYYYSNYQSYSNQRNLYDEYKSRPETIDFLLLLATVDIAFLIILLLIFLLIL